ncbi:hypothetical protein [Streptomyces fungicidicus]|uniref:hypothetical protein n=1 Tax=Streptomyces fungicidicus TaxID=68203 RepID=UPI003D72144E
MAVHASKAGATADRTAQEQERRLAGPKRKSTDGQADDADVTHRRQRPRRMIRRGL